MSLSRACWIEARSTLISLLTVGNRTLQDDTDLRTKALVPQDGAKMHLPAKIGKIPDYRSYVLDQFYSEIDKINDSSPQTLIF